MTDETRNNISTAIYSFGMIVGLFTSSIELILFSGFYFNNSHNKE